MIMEGTKPIIMIMEGTRPNAYDYGGHKAYNYDYGGHPAPAGPALPNLINAVKMLKSKQNRVVDFDFDFDFDILTAFIRLGRAGPRQGAGCPP